MAVIDRFVFSRLPYPLKAAGAARRSCLSCRSICGRYSHWKPCRIRFNPLNTSQTAEAAVSDTDPDPIQLKSSAGGRGSASKSRKSLPRLAFPPSRTMPSRRMPSRTIGRQPSRRMPSRSGMLRSKLRLAHSWQQLRECCRFDSRAWWSAVTDALPPVLHPRHPPRAQAGGLKRGP